MRKFTLNELSRLTGRLKLYALPMLCEVCDEKKRYAQAEMTLVTQTGIPICICLTCASKLIAFSAKRAIDVDNVQKRQPQNGTPASKRGRPRKVAQ